MVIDQSTRWPLQGQMCELEQNPMCLVQRLSSVPLHLVLWDEIRNFGMTVELKPAPKFNERVCSQLHLRAQQSFTLSLLYKVFKEENYKVNGKVQNKTNYSILGFQSQQILLTFKVIEQGWHSRLVHGIGARGPEFDSRISHPCFHFFPFCVA